MAKPGKIIEYSWTWEGDTYKLFGKEDGIENILDAIQSQGLVNPAPQTVSVGGHTRKRYPGAPSWSVSGFSRVTLVGGRPNLRTLPGENAYFEFSETGPNGTANRTVQVSFTGPFTALYQFTLANALIEMTLRSPDGTPYDITLSEE
jgi:hypothetical protein